MPSTNDHQTSCRCKNINFMPTQPQSDPTIQTFPHSFFNPKDPTNEPTSKKNITMPKSSPHPPQESKCNVSPRVKNWLFNVKDSPETTNRPLTPSPNVQCAAFRKTVCTGMKHIEGLISPKEHLRFHQAANLISQEVHLSACKSPQFMLTEIRTSKLPCTEVSSMLMCKGHRSDLLSFETLVDTGVFSVPHLEINCPNNFAKFRPHAMNCIKNAKQFSPTASKRSAKPLVWINFI